MILEATLPNHMQEDGWDVCNKETGKGKNTVEKQGDREQMIESTNYTHWGNSEASQGSYFPKYLHIPPPKHSYFYTVSDLAALDDDDGHGTTWSLSWAHRRILDLISVYEGYIYVPTLKLIFYRFRFFKQETIKRLEKKIHPSSYSRWEDKI